MISPPIESRDAQPFRPQLNQPQVAHFLQGAVDMDWRQTGDVGKVQLRQWHRAQAAIAKVNSLQPIKEFTEQMAQLFNGALEIGRAHARPPVTNAHLVCRHLHDKTKQYRKTHKST